MHHVLLPLVGPDARRIFLAWVDLGRLGLLEVFAIGLWLVWRWLGLVLVWLVLVLGRFVLVLGWLGLVLGWLGLVLVGFCCSWSGLG